MPVRLPAILAVLALPAALPAGASALTTVPAPAVSGVYPQRVNVGDEMTVRGRDFVPGRRRDQVVFARPGIRPVFFPADVSGVHSLRIRLPAKLLPYLAQYNGAVVPTRFRITVLSTRMGKTFRSAARSPVIGPPGSGIPIPGGVDCNGDGVQETAVPQALGVPLRGLRLTLAPLSVPGLPEPTRVYHDILPPIAPDGSDPSNPSAPPAPPPPPPPPACPAP